MQRSTRRENVRTLGFLVGITVIALLGLVTHNDALGLILTVVLCGGYIAWWFWSYWHPK